MRWKQGRRSRNVEDRRGRSIPKGVKGVGGGIGGMLIIALIAMFLGKDPSQLLALLGGQLGGGTSSGTVAASTPEEEELADFVSVVLGDTEDVWNDLFGRMGRQYEEPALVLFRDAVSSACGNQSSSTGPFYCPADDQVYLDLSFFEDLKRKLGAPGDFAQAYVIAHEVGHHVQNLLGISGQVHEQKRSLGQADANDLSVRLELQADFFAGVWAHHAQQARQILERGDLEEALNAASRIGDDHLQRQATGRVRPDSFTHGTSEQRMRWFSRGFESGDPAEGDTFSARNL